MRFESRLRRLEQSQTSIDLVNAWLAQALEYPCVEDYVLASSLIDEPASPLGLLRREIERLATSQPASTRSEWIARTKGDTLVLYHIARQLQDAAAGAVGRWHAAGHIRHSLEPHLEPGWDEIDEEDRQHQLRMWVPWGQRVLTELAVHAQVRRTFEHLYFRGRDIRYRDDRGLDAPTAFEAGLVRQMLDTLAVDTTVGDVSRWKAPTKVEISLEVRSVFELAQWRSLQVLGEDEKADALWRVMHSGGESG